MCARPPGRSRSACAAIPLDSAKPVLSMSKGCIRATQLILFGVVLLSMLTANLAAFFIGGDVEKMEREEQEADRQLKEISARLERIERLLEERPNS